MQGRGAGEHSAHVASGELGVCVRVPFFSCRHLQAKFWPRPEESGQRPGFEMTICSDTSSKKKKKKGGVS